MYGSSAAAAVVTAVLVTAMLLPVVWRLAGTTLGLYLRKRTEGQRKYLVETMAADEVRFREENGGVSPKRTKESSGDGDDWDGIVGFFHPFCNAGGGGERVLWAAIRATQQKWPRAKCVVYTGDHDVTKDAILARVRDRFNIHLHPPTVQFLYLSTRRWVLASTWPHFTLAGQSAGSVVMAWDALSLLVPDIFIDTMGYAFALGLVKFLFGAAVPTGAYVHYPTISTDMLASLDPASKVGAQGVNAGQGIGLRGRAKRVYWELFAAVYARVGATIDVVMTNSTWTQAHVQALWGPRRASSGGNTDGPTDISVVYPPVAVAELEQAVDVSEASEAAREPVLLYIAQFRPEKNHHLILEAFAKFMKKWRQDNPEAQGSDSDSDNRQKPRLVLVGSVRDSGDKTRVYELRLLANELGIRDDVDFQKDVPWPDILQWLRRASVGVNGMWNEHFGIGVVEYQAAGLVSVVHDSGGPKLDIVITDMDDGLPTGFHATTADEFADAFAKALAVPDPLAWRLRARQSAKRFTEEVFDRKWLDQMGRLVRLSML